MRETNLAFLWALLVSLPEDVVPFHLLGLSLSCSSVALAGTLFCWDLVRTLSPELSG